MKYQRKKKTQLIVQNGSSSNQSFYTARSDRKLAVIQFWHQIKESIPRNSVNSGVFGSNALKTECYC